MKTCPYCGEKVQDAAIVCKHCGRDLSPEAVAAVSRGLTKGAFKPKQQQLSAEPSANLTLGELLILAEKGYSLHPSASAAPPEAPPQVGETEPTFSVDGVEMLYAGMLAELRRMKPQEIARYPLSVDRKPRVIAEGMVKLFEGHEFELKALLPMWWNTSANPKDVKRGKVDDWATMAEMKLGIERSSPMFPTEDEWLSISAATMVAFHRSPRVKGIMAIDMIDAWRSLAKGRNADRILRGITFFGAIANLATAFSAPKPPKQGSFQWNVWRRAAAQVEASSLLLVE